MLPCSMRPGSAHEVGVAVGTTSAASVTTLVAVGTTGGVGRGTLVGGGSAVGGGPTPAVGRIEAAGSAPHPARTAPRRPPARRRNRSRAICLAPRGRLMRDGRRRLGHQLAI